MNWRLQTFLEGVGKGLALISLFVFIFLWCVEVVPWITWKLIEEKTNKRLEPIELKIGELEEILKNSQSSVDKP